MTGTTLKKAKRFRFSVIDFVIILLLLASIVGIVIRYNLVDKLFSKTSLVDAEITFIAEAVSPAEVACFTQGATFYEGDTAFGTLQALKSDKAVIYTENDAGYLVSYEDATLLDLDGTFLCEVLPTENGYLLNGNRYVAAGSVITLRSNGVNVTVTVLSIKVSEG